MQQAKITVSGVSRSSEGTTRLETVNEGTFTEKNGYCYVRYEETEASGMEGTTTTVKWNSSTVALIRHGSYEMRQEFAEGTSCAGDYRTPYLMIPIETKTKKVRVKKLPYGWKLQLDYDLAYAATDVNRIATTIVVDLR
ncbi:MAG: DUF1934 domain-containing protein [Acidaminococcaceae bacterium]|nr:DUF1934 domain-containing protein [Acidaminococcaceae bacterium]MBO6266577.1 DUF1934 domain-containing protein [Acidaminococcaceae bacterium]